MGCRATLGELCTFHRGASVPRARMFNSGNYLYIHYGDLYRGFEQRIDVEDPAKPLPFILDSEKIKETQFLHDQDIVFVLTSETVDDLGHAFLFNNPRNRIAVSGTETTIVRIQRKDMVLPAYLNYVMQSPRFIAELRQYVRGMKVFRVHPNDAARIPIDLPSLDKQAKVVAILDAIFEKRLINNRLNGYLEELGQSLLSECLRSCGDMLPLSSVMSLGSGFAFKSSTYTNDGKFKIMTIKNVQDGSVDCSNSNRIDDPPKKMRGFCNLQLGSVVLSLTGNVGRVGIVSEEDCLLNQRVAVIQPHQSSLLPGLYFYFRQKSFQNEMIGIARGTAQANLSPLETLQLEIPYDKQAFDEVNSSLLPVFDLILANKVESTKLANLRDTLLPKLMSGEIDVSKVDLKQLNSHLADCLVQPSPEGIPVFHKWPSADQPTEDQLDSP